MTDLLKRLLEKRVAPIPGNVSNTVFKNADGPEAAEAIERLSAALLTVAFCPPKVPADALRHIAQEAALELYPELGQSSDRKMVHYLKCDAKGCLHIEMHPALTWDMVDKPCPCCGANLLTQADAEAYPYMEGNR